MKRWKSICAVGLVSLLSAVSLVAQGRGGGSTGPPVPGIGPSNAPSRSTSPRSQRRTLDLQGPVYISGRILMETGQPIRESIGVELACESTSMQAIRTDLGGYFTFSLGGGMDSSMDFSAANDNFPAVGRNVGNLPRGYNGSLRGCEVRVSVPGYFPLSYPLTEHPQTGRIEVGTLRLRRIADVPGSYVSLTSLMVPDKARKEFEQAIKDLEKKRSDSAQQHLEKAVALYEDYAAAWNELGQVHLTAGQNEKAREAFEKAIEADPQYLQPHINMASLQLQEKQWQGAVEAAERILNLDPSLSLANFIQAVGNFNLHALEAAEKSALEAEKRPHENIPQVHVLLAEIFLQKQDYARAETQMRTYLEEAPDGPYAERVKKELEGIEKFSGTSETTSTPPVEAGP